MSPDQMGGKLWISCGLGGAVAAEYCWIGASPLVILSVAVGAIAFGVLRLMSHQFPTRRKP